MIEFVCTPLHVRIAPQVFHGNHLFSHSPNEFMFRNILFSFRGAQEFFLAPMKICQGGAR